MNKCHAYPPNFTISTDGSRAQSDAVAEFNFKGALQRELVYEIPLLLPDDAPHVSRCIQC